MGRPRLVHITTIPMTIEAFLLGQMAYLEAHGFAVEAISSPGEAADRMRRDGVAFHPLPMERRIDPAADARSLAALIALLRRLRPDVVHSHTPKAALLGTLAARAVGTKAVVLSIHGLPQMTRTGISRRLLDTTTRVGCSLAHGVWCVSSSIRDHMIEQGLCSRRKVFVIGQGSVCGVDAARRFDPQANLPGRAAVRARLGIPEGATVVGFVGRIVRDKGLGELESAWSDLRERFPALHLLLVGPFETEDPLGVDVETRLRADPRVHLAGMQRDVPAHLAAMDVFTMPSYREGFGIANIEAAAMGLPVVSTRIPGCVDAVQDAVTGTLVPVRDAGALARAIARYVQDPELAAMHGAAGRARVLRDFQPEAIWSELADRYRALLS